MRELYDFLDRMIAEVLNVPVGVYVKKIEATSEKRAHIIILGLMSEDEETVKKAIRVFNLL